MLEPDQPGCPARIYTYPNEEDMDAMLEDIRKAKTLADVFWLMKIWQIGSNGHEGNY